MLARFWDPRTARVLFTALLFALVLAFLHGTRETLTLFLFAILFAYFVEPLVSRLEKPLRGRIKAIALVYLLLIAILAIAGTLVGARVADESKSLATGFPALIEKMGSGQLVSDVGQQHGWSEQRQAQIQTFLVTHRNEILSYGRTLGAKIAEPATHTWWLILIPILSLFFLKDGRSIAETIIGLGRTGEEKQTLRGVVSDVNVMLGSYIRAQLILAGLTLVAYTLVLSLMRVPYAFVLGPIAGILEFVPVVGPAVAAITVIVIAIISTYPHILWVVLFLLAWRLIQDYVSAPRVMGDRLEISPLLQIFGVLAGAEIAGVVGALVSVPAIATLRILWRRLSSEQGPDASLTGGRDAPPMRP